MEPDDRPQADLLITGASVILTCVPRSGDPLGRLAGGSVAVAGERLLAVGPAAEVAAGVEIRSARVIDAAGKVVAPGFVDSHTHLVFGGSRVGEYVAGLTRTPDEVRALGIPTGILSTVEMTRATSLEALTAGAAGRLRRMLAHGTTTVESKSGYGLSLEHELKLLEANRRVRALVPVDVVSTFLGAHAVPADVPRARYVDLVVEEMVPAVADKGLADFCDVYCDEGYFNRQEARRILEAGLAAGLRPKIHADQYSAIGAADLAAELRAVSADHLNYTSRESMRRLAGAGVVGVVMPLIDFAVQHPRPCDARAMLDEGLTLALATDLCPACWAESLQLAMQFVCRLNRLAPEEALLAATVGGARALGLDDRGTLAPGLLADLQIWDLPSFEDLIYRLGHNAVETVIKRGRVVVQREPGGIPS